MGCGVSVIRIPNSKQPDLIITKDGRGGQKKNENEGEAGASKKGSSIIINISGKQIKRTFVDVFLNTNELL
jgi:hypothetical protein